MGLGSSLKKTWKRVTGEVKDIARQASENVGDLGRTVSQTPGLDYLINPLIAQDIAGAAFGGSLMRGADARTALANASGASGDLIAGGSSGQWADLAAFNAALLGGAAAGAAPAGAAAGFGWTPAVSGSAWTGAAAGTAAGALAMPLAAGTEAKYSGGLFGSQTNSGGSAEAPPDVNYANDPNTAAQFQRLRKASRALGRAGTFKNKGANSALGLGDSVLGDQLSLIGS